MSLRPTPVTMTDADGGADSIGPALNAFAVLPSDTAAVAARSIYVGGAGDVAVTMQGGGTVTFKAVPAGAILPVRVSKVFMTGTTATNLVGLA